MPTARRADFRAQNSMSDEVPVEAEVVLGEARDQEAAAVAVVEAAAGAGLGSAGVMFVSACWRC